MANIAEGVRGVDTGVTGLGSRSTGCPNPVTPVSTPLTPSVILASTAFVRTGHLFLDLWRG